MSLRADPYSKQIVFGDSLSDTGNLDQGGLIGELIAFFAEVGPTGTFSNGPVWHDYLADDLALPRAEPSRDGGDNYAFGGAKTDRSGAISDLFAIPLLGQQTGIEAQVEIFVQSLPPAGADAAALYIVWGGGNDLRDASSPAAAAVAVDNMDQNIRNLAAAGAQHFLVPNLPNLGRTPESIQQGEAAVALAETVSQAFNDQLSTALSLTAEELSLDIVQLDVFAGLEGVIAFPEYYGLTNVTEPCPNPDSDCVGYLFRDDIHPTTAGHALLGYRAFELLRGPLAGDMDGDIDVDFDDIDDFVLGLTNGLLYEAVYGAAPSYRGDLDGDGDQDFDDISGLVALLTIGHATPALAAWQLIPEPPTLCLACLAALGVCLFNRANKRQHPSCLWRPGCCDCDGRTRPIGLPAGYSNWNGNVSMAAAK